MPACVAAFRQHATRTCEWDARVSMCCPRVRARMCTITPALHAHSHANVPARLSTNAHRLHKTARAAACAPARPSLHARGANAYRHDHRCTHADRCIGATADICADVRMRIGHCVRQANAHRYGHCRLHMARPHTHWHVGNACAPCMRLEVMPLSGPAPARRRTADACTRRHRRAATACARRMCVGMMPILVQDARGSACRRRERTVRVHQRAVDARATMHAHRCDANA